MLLKGGILMHGCFILFMKRQPWHQIPGHGSVRECYRPEPAGTGEKLCQRHMPPPTKVTTCLLVAIEVAQGKIKLAIFNYFEALTYTKKQPTCLSCSHAVNNKKISATFSLPELKTTLLWHYIHLSFSWVCCVLCLRSWSLKYFTEPERKI